MNKSQPSEMSEKEIDQVWQTVLERVDGPRYESHLNGRIRGFWPIVNKALAATLLVGMGGFGWLLFDTRDSVHQIESQGTVPQPGRIAMMKSEAPINSPREYTARSPIDIAQARPHDENLQDPVHQLREPTAYATSKPIEQNRSETQAAGSLVSETALTVPDGGLIPSHAEGAVETASIGFDFLESTPRNCLIDLAEAKEKPMMSPSKAIQQQKLSMKTPVEDLLVQPKRTYEKLGVPPPWKADPFTDTDLLREYKRRQEQHGYKIEYEYFAKTQPRGSGWTPGIRF